MRKYTMAKLSCMLVIASVSVIFGLLFLACGVGLVPYIIRQKIREGVTLRPGSEALKTWLDPPVPIFINFYFFHVNNTKQLNANFTQPVVIQRGPYVYREIRNKSDYEFINAGATLRYHENKWYVFDRNLSCGDENDTLITLNIPLVTLATKVRFMSPRVLNMIRFLLDMTDLKLFETHTVKELLWGYHMDLPSVLSRLLTSLGIDLTVGIYVGPTANGTNDGIYEVDAGIHDISELGRVTGWRHSPALPYWSDTPCNMINGTDGTFYHPSVGKSERLYLFNSDLCRSIYIERSADVSIHDINTYRFIAPSDMFADPRVNLDNRGFCTPDSTGCLLAGVLNVSECKGAPIMMSEPHFYQADPLYQNAVIGIKPDPKYQTFLDIEPNTGAALNISKQIQVNIFLRRLKVLSGTDNMKDNDSIVFPILWLNEHAEINDSVSQKLHSQVLSPVFTACVVGYVLCAIGGLLLLTGLVIFVLLLIRKRCAPLKKQTPVRMGQGDEDAALLDAGSA